MSIVFLSEYRDRFRRLTLGAGGLIVPSRLPAVGIAMAVVDRTARNSQANWENVTFEPGWREKLPTLLRPLTEQRPHMGPLPRLRRARRDVARRPPPS